MRRTASRTGWLLAIAVAMVVIAAVLIAVHGSAAKMLRSAARHSIAQVIDSARAHSLDTPQSSPGKDSAAAGEKDKPRAGSDKPQGAKEKTVSIRIDESGIRIDTPTGDADSSAERIIFEGKGWSREDDGRRYNETGADIVRFGEDVTVDANELVRGDVVVFGADASIAGKVIGNVVVLMGDARVVSGAEINGDMVVVGGTLHEEDEVIIHGERVMLKHFNFSLGGFPFHLGRQFKLFEFLFIPVKFFISLVLSCLVVLFLKDRIVKSHEHVSRGVLKSFGTGFLVAFVGIFVVTLLTIILVITLIGIPLAFVLVVSCIALFFVADTVFVYALGSKVGEKLNIQTTNPFAVVLIGMAVLYLPGLLGFGISLLPFGGFAGGFLKVFGWLFGLFAFLAGLGALFLSRFGGRGVTAAVAAATISPSPAGPVTPQ